MAWAQVKKKKTYAEYDPCPRPMAWARVKMRGYPCFCFSIPIAFAKIYFLRMVPIWRKILRI